MKYDVSYNFEEGLIEKFGEIGNVHSIYAKLNSDIVGGGRPSSTLPVVSIKSLENHIKRAHEQKIKFNYLLNSVCLGNKELVKEDYFNILKYIDEIVEMGVDSVTVANPFLCDMVKKAYPNLEVCLSVNVRVHTLQQIKYWEDFGVDEITLDQIVNRNFPLLEAMLEHTKNTKTRLRLFANNICLHDCPMRTYHGLANSHASQEGNKLKEHLHYYYYKCTEMKMSDPSKLISATWIRPDDVHYYEELMKKTKNENLILKLVERASTSEYLISLLHAYKNEKFDGNLMDIIYAIQRKYMIPNGKKETNNYYKPETLGKIMSLFDLNWFSIDNRKLDGFLEHFVNNYNCDRFICSQDAQSKNSCTYCYQWAKNAVTYDEEKRNQYLKNLDNILHDMQSGEVFF